MDFVAHFITYSFFSFSVFVKPPIWRNGFVMASAGRVYVVFISWWLCDYMYSFFDELQSEIWIIISHSFGWGDKATMYVVRLDMFFITMTRNAIVTHLDLKSLCDKALHKYVVNMASGIANTPVSRDQIFLNALWPCDATWRHGPGQPCFR